MKILGIGLYDINGKKVLSYVSPREILSNDTRTYNNKTYKYTHGYGAIITAASNTSETGTLKYVNSSFEDSEKDRRIFSAAETKNCGFLRNDRLCERIGYVAATAFR